MPAIFLEFENSELSFKPNYFFLFILWVCLENTSDL